MTFSETNKLDFAMGADVGIKSSHYGIYLSNVLSGIGSYMFYNKGFNNCPTHVAPDVLCSIL